MREEKENTIPLFLLKQTIWTIRGYYFFKEFVGNPDNRDLLPLTRYPEYLQIIDEEKEKIPEEYRTEVWNHVLYNCKFPNRNLNSYFEQKDKFITGVSARLHSR